MQWGALEGGVQRTATVQVRNIAGQPCAGNFIVVFYCGVAPGYTVDFDGLVTVTNGTELGDLAAAVMAITNNSGVATFRVESNTAGQTGYGMATVLGIVDASDVAQF